MTLSVETPTRSALWLTVLVVRLLLYMPGDDIGRGIDQRKALSNKENFRGIHAHHRLEEIIYGITFRRFYLSVFTLLRFSPPAWTGGHGGSGVHGGGVRPETLGSAARLFRTLRWLGRCGAAMMMMIPPARLPHTLPYEKPKCHVDIHPSVEGP